MAIGADTAPATCRRAVAAAVLAPPGDEGAAAHVAADALIAAARSGDTAALAEVLRPDPTVPVSTWTVARYQAGDVSPSTIEEHADPCAAVLSTAAPGAAHEATAELIAVSGGLRWTPLALGHAGLVFHPPEAWTLAEGEASGAAAATAAERWHRRSRLWVDAPRPTSPSRPAPAAPAPRSPASSSPSSPARPAQGRTPSGPTPTPPPTPPPAGRRPNGAPTTAAPSRSVGAPATGPGSLASAVAAAVAGTVDGWPGRAEVSVEEVVAEVRRHLGTPLSSPRRSTDGTAVVGGDVLLPMLAALTSRLEAAAAAHERTAAVLADLLAELRGTNDPT